MNFLLFKILQMFRPKNKKCIKQFYDCWMWHICIIILGLISTLFSPDCLLYVFAMQIMFYLDKLEIPNFEATSDKASKDKVSL